MLMPGYTNTKIQLLWCKCYHAKNDIIQKTISYNCCHENAVMQMLSCKCYHANTMMQMLWSMVLQAQKKPIVIH